MAQPKLTIQMEQSERDRLRREAIRLCAEGRLPAPTIAALVRAAVRAFLREEMAYQVLTDLVAAINDEDRPAFREPVLSADELALLERAEAALGRKEER